MILSLEQLFSDKQAITATAISTNVVDTGIRGTPHGAVGPLTGDKGKGNSVPLLVQVTEDFNNLTDLTINVETGATTALGTVVCSQNILLADAVAGKQFCIDELPNGVSERYLGIRYTVAGTAPTVGAITAGISAGNQTNVTGV